jgi:hypothetical protein
MTMNPLDEATPAPEGNPAAEAAERLAAAAGPGFDKTQMDVLKAKLAKLGKSDAKTTSGSEAPPENAPEPTQQQALTGAMVDWSEYDLNYNVAHLYKSAVYRDTPNGPAWVVMITDFLSTSRDFRNYGQRVNTPGSNDKKFTEPLNLGEYLNDKVNGKDQWKIAAVMPAGTQCGILLERQVPLILPEPQPLKKSEEVAPPSDPQLQAVEDAALAFAAEQGMAPEIPVDTEPVVEDYPYADTLRPIERGTPEHEAAVSQLDDTGSLEARTSGSMVQKALQTAAPLTEPAPTAGFEQPEGIENPLLGNAKVPAAGYSAAQELLRALNDPNFRAQLPKDE